MPIQKQFKSRLNRLLNLDNKKVTASSDFKLFFHHSFSPSNSASKSSYSSCVMVTGLAPFGLLGGPK